MRTFSIIAIFAVAIGLTTSCSAKKKVIEQGRSLEMSQQAAASIAHSEGDTVVTMAALMADSMQAQMQASVDVWRQDSCLTVRVTDYDRETGLPVRTTETSRSASSISASANAAMMLEMSHRLTELQHMQSHYDSLLAEMYSSAHEASRDTTFVSQSSRPSAAPAVTSFLSIALLIVVVLMAWVAYRIYRR